MRRQSGWLPPLPGVRKRIAGDRGTTAVGPLPGLPFRVDGRSLRYLPPFAAFVDVLEPGGPGRWRGTATFRGRAFARFTLERVRDEAG